MDDAPVLALEQVSRRFNGVAAVDRLSVSVRPGEFFSLLGPSGCGKTTTLRLIAGFEEPEPDGGTIRMLGAVVNGKRPYQRPIGMVFQNYALFPHLDVAANVAFGLEERRVRPAEIRPRVDRALELMRLDPATYRTRRPAELSGGQRQRVALARALVLEPPILLLDEPLGALDLQLRKTMQVELRQLNRALGITFILVTHDQEEALAMSDRVAVMAAGQIVQVGTPAQVYDHPLTAFVANFIGEANLFAGVVEQVTGDTATVVQPDGNRWRIPAATTWAPGASVQVAVRPERHELLDIVATPGERNALRGRIREIIFLGEIRRALVTLGDGRDVRVTLRNDGAESIQPWQVDQDVLVAWRVQDARMLEP